MPLTSIQPAIGFMRKRWTGAFGSPNSDSLIVAHRFRFFGEFFSSGRRHSKGVKQWKLIGPCLHLKDWRYPFASRCFVAPKLSANVSRIALPFAYLQDLMHMRI